MSYIPQLGDVLEMDNVYLENGFIFSAGFGMPADNIKQWIFGRYGSLYYYKYFTDGGASDGIFDIPLQAESISFSIGGVLINNSTNICSAEVNKPKSSIDSSLYLFKRATLKDNGIGHVGKVVIKDKINMIPCLDNNGIPCFFDTIRQKSFYNAGEGELTYSLKN